MKRIYIVATHMPTFMGKLIRTVTRFYYNHVSFAFCEDLIDLVSFARYHHELPLVGGYVHECNQRISKGIVRVLYCDVDDYQYEEIKQFVDRIEQNPSEYRYNLINAILSPLHKRIPIKNYYTCIEFISEILTIAQINQNGKVLTTKEICFLLDENRIYEGPITDFVTELKENRDYFQHFKVLDKIKITLQSVKIMVKSMKNRE